MTSTQKPSESDQIATAPIDPGAEPMQGPPPGVSGKQENAQFAAASRQHELALLKQEMGWLGGIFGSVTTAPTNIGGLAVLLPILFIGFSFFFTNSPELNEARKWAGTLATGAVGYLFGAAKK